MGEWWKRGAIYQIYPRSFADSNGDGVGDLRGIAAHLDHLQDLKVTAIWLSPIFPSPMADFGYDVADYRDVDPIFGSLADLDALIDQAHHRGIKVILDWVPNHTSDRHAWFEQSRSSRDNPKRDWYVWRDGKDGGPPNAWRSVFEAVGPAWTYDDTTGQWYLHSFMREQPDLNWDNPEVEAAMHDTIRFWLDRGVDGLRLDAIHRFAKDPELKDNTPERRHDEDWPTIHDRIRRIREVVDDYEDRMIVGEVALYDLKRTVAYLAAGDQLHMAHNFVFINLPWSAEAFAASIAEFEALADETAWPAWFIANHDHPRVASRFGAPQARAVLTLLYTLRGTPFIYQGEELALPDARIAPDQVVDVDGRDPERAPIPWTAQTPGHGFTTGTPWLPFPDAPDAASQAEDPDSPLNLTRRLAALREAEPALQTGRQTPFDAGPDILAYTRGDDILVAINFAQEPRPLPATGSLLLSSDPRRTSASPELRPGEALVLRRR